MRVLWISNVLFPEVCYELHIIAPVVGGWMYSGATALLETNPDIKLAVVALYPGKVLKCIDNYKIRYYLIPSNGGGIRNSVRLELYYNQVKAEFNPDIVHIHGSESPHSLAWINACGKDKVVVSIQGLVSIYTDYYLGGICEKDIKKSITIRDILRNDSLFDQQKKMKKRGECEQKLLKSVDYIIGRTSWDKSHAWAINPDATYHFCNETLRSSFYRNKWRYDDCIKYSIFLSQAQTPIKGIQQLVKALSIVLKYYPETKVFVAGNNFMKTSSFRKNGFSNYLEQLMKKDNVADKFEFLGMLDEQEMVNWYMKSNVFVCPSSIENSPNSVGEAQLVGTPCIASYVGGSMDMVKDGETGYLYRFEETTLLAMRICELFADSKQAEAISGKERKVAFERHDGKKNAESLNNIYKTIVNENIPNL